MRATDREAKWVLERVQHDDLEVAEWFVNVASTLGSRGGRAGPKQNGAGIAAGPAVARFHGRFVIRFVRYRTVRFDQELAAVMLDRAPRVRSAPKGTAAS